MKLNIQQRKVINIYIYMPIQKMKMQGYSRIECSIKIITLMVILSLVPRSRASCSYSQCLSCAQSGYSTCYENNAGSHITCDPNSYTSYSQYYITTTYVQWNAYCCGGYNQCNGCYVDGSYDSCCSTSYVCTSYCYSSSQNVVVRRKCHAWCLSCDGQNNPTQHCQTCKSGYYRYYNQHRCSQYCPSAATGDYGVTQTGQYFPATYSQSGDANQCQMCHTYCSVCKGGAALTDCYSCRSTYLLIGQYSTCVSNANTNGAVGPQGPEYPSDCYDIQCISGCPSHYYFQIAQSTVNSSYSTWSYADTVTLDSYGSYVVNYRRFNQAGVCYLCNYHCLSCNGPNQNQCTKCKRYNYKQVQYVGGNNYYCRERCIFGTYDGATRGEYISNATVSAVSNIGNGKAQADRFCQLCDVGCRWCMDTSSACYQCTNTYFLVDLKAECQARFLTPGNCPICTASSMCNTVPDKSCVTSCPTYYYFKVYRVDPTGTTFTTYPLLAASHQRYSGWRTGASMWYLNGNNNANNATAVYYRDATNLCLLCDDRCIKCDGPLNSNCTACRNNYYKWTHTTICDNYCPGFQWISSTTTCDNCHVNCRKCQGSYLNCSECRGANYSFVDNATDKTTAFLYATNSSESRCMNTCPTQPTDFRTKIGYYGSFKTMTCLPCPTPCSNCNINIIWNNYPTISCGTDNTCSVGLVCTNCLTGYEVVGGKCISENTCREYAYYVEPAVSAAWSAVNCKCLDGYSSTTYAKCNIRCHITCQTCTGTANTQCLTCYTGAYKDSSNRCVLNTTTGLYAQEWYPGYWNVAASDNTASTACGMSSYFGYRYSTSSKYFGYTFSIPSTNYYAIRIKIGLLLVDEYNTRGAFYISRDSSTGAQLWSWNYNTKGAYGQQLCGTNKMDHIIFVTAELPTRGQTSENFYLSSNQATLQTNQAGLALHWGVVGVYVTVLKCDTACLTCTGPSPTQCTVCATTQTPTPQKIAVNGSCVCNIAGGFYQWADGTCNQGCPTGSGWFKDDQTRKCVKPPLTSNCTAPKRFGDSMGTSGYGTCVQVCPTGYYSSMKQMKCTQDCYTDGPGQYKFDGGASRSCQDICPAPYVKDILNRKCALICPSGSYLQLQNVSTDPTCIVHCATGWQYDGLQLCVTTCPNGYFKQVDTSGNKKCVKTCVNAFGNVDTGQCTLSCPFPKYADSNNRLCVDQCSLATHYMQVAVSNLNRTCVTKCENGQYGNPFTKKCSNYTTQCPDGYYADNYLNNNLCVANCTGPSYVAENSTKKCQTSCSTGFAHWPSKACVAICPKNQSLFGYLTTKQCVSNCNFATTGLYGDAQANRTCVAKCTASPTPTFGQNTTSLCVDKCTGSTQYGDEGDPYRRCVTDCSGVPQRYADTDSKLCLLKCPDTYFGQLDPANNNRGRCVKICLSPLFGDPQTNMCRSKCKIGFWGDQTSGRQCVKQCPRYWFGKDPIVDRICVRHTNCSSGYFGDIDTGMCINNKSLCSNTTYADLDKQLCVTATNCTQGKFADPFTKGCQSSCSNGYYADNNINTCVPMCSDSYDEYGQWGLCKYTCDGGRYADAQANRTCVNNCTRTPLALFGITTGRKRCVQAMDCPAGYFGDNLTLTCINPCKANSSLPFGDPLTRTCVYDCPDGYYGDNDTHLCVQKCDFSTYHYADNQTGNCQTLCTLGTFGVNSSAADSIPSCEYDCPSNSYARDTDRICVADCQTGLFGDPITRVCYSSPFSCSDGYFANDVSHKCVLPSACQTVGTHYFAQNSTKTCVQVCDDPNYGDTQNWYCVPKCNTTSYGENTTNLCKPNCVGYSAYAQKQNSLCVARCSDTPIKHYAQDSTYTCVQAKNCPVIGGVQTYARNSTQKCQLSCPNGQWADPTTLRCVSVCPNAYYADNSSGLNICTQSCPDGANYRFRDNSTKSCVNVCPASNSTFGYILGDTCVYTCPPSYFAQVDANRLCVSPCKTGTWGNKVSRVCITQPLAQCPTGTWADNFTQKCEEVCDASSGYYGYNATKMCVTSCISPTFAWDGSRVCIDICPASLTDSGYFGDATTSPTRKCFQTCQGAGLYRDPAASRTCQLSCTYTATYKTYKDPTTMSCQAHCSNYPQVRYADDNLKSCQLSCAGSLKKDESARTCVSTCPYLYDPTTDKCVDQCPTQSTLGDLYANLTSNNNTCIVASSCPTGTWADADSRTCASSCPTGTYKYSYYCVVHCPNDYFMDALSQSCVTPSNCETGKYADNQTRSCVSQCVGTYGDSTLRRCIDVCYGTKYGDPYTHTCQTSCSNGLRINSVTRTCQANCVIGTYSNPATGTCSSSCSTPYYADNTTMACVTSCSANPMTFANVASVGGARECVGRCQVTKMHDMVNRICVAPTACPANTYSYSINMSCVSFCPGPSYYQLQTACVLNCSSHATLKYADDTTRKCVGTCPSGSYKDTLSYKCVTACPTAPTQYFISASQNKCTTSCPQGTYADLQQLKCVTSCSLAPPMYAQQVNNVCVQSCPTALNSFADATTGKCVTSCPSGYFADSRDRICKTNCSFLFADSIVVPKACVQNCTTGTYADQLSFTCGGTCPPNYYKHTPTKRCVQFCPYGYFLNPTLSLCVVNTNCPSTLPYADNYTRKCTSSCAQGRWGYLASGTTTGGDCRSTCPSPFYSNPLTGKCQTGCPAGLYADTDNNTCMSTCSYDRFMDSVNRKCQKQCPSANSLFADLYNRSCVTSCDPAKLGYADTLTRRCEPTCTGNQYADDNGQKCVAAGACSGGNFSDLYYKKCVPVCYNGTYGYQGKCIPDCPTATNNVYASQVGRLCVTATNCPAGTFGDPILHKCVQFCPIQSATFADHDSHKCVTGCTGTLFADNLTRQCVQTCPNVSKMYGDTVNHKCVHACSYPYFADQTTNLCKTGCPNGYFADLSTLTCVQKCPQGKFGNNQTNTCDNTCPSLPRSYFGDPDTRKCVLSCPQGKFADKDNNRQCHPKCVGSVDTFAQNTTGQCQGTCATGFSNILTKQCIGKCSAGYFGYNKVCYQDCPRVSPIVFADNVTHRCVETCPDGTYGDLFALKCVKICPISRGTFADTGTKRCVGQCPGSQYANPASRMCVGTCPQVPALYGKLPEKVCVSQCTFGLYANNATRTCQSGCPFGTYADNTTYKCQPYCPRNPLMFGQNITNKCIKNCWADRNMYADNATGTCVYHCTNGTFADSTTRKCVTTCPSGYFALNRTKTCETRCDAGTFADTLLRICVSKCSVNPIFYGDNVDSVCLPECPPTSYGNPLTQQCVYDSAGRSTCPANYYADPRSKLCVQVCPAIFDLYADPNTKKCQTGCSGALIADNSTMRCVQKCPTYPSSFADLTTSRCIFFCPDGTFSDDISRTCVTDCPTDSYADNSTNRCVAKCPQQPLTYADDTNWQCVTVCPQGLYADNSTLKCVPSCPLSQRTFAQNTTNECVRVCPLNSYGDTLSGYCVSRCYGGRFSDVSSRLCVQVCPSYPPRYADPSSDQCVQTCPPWTYAYERNRTCIGQCPLLQGLYRQNTTSSCVPKCKSSYADNTTGFCVSRCSVDSWADPTIKVCVAICPDQPLLYADNTTQSCVERCPGSTFGQNSTRACVNTCPTGSLSLPQNNLCVRYCPIGYFADNSTAFCYSQCAYPLYGDPSTRSCVPTCPLNQLLFADNSSRQCVKYCPPNSYADKKSVQCVSTCPTADPALGQAQTYAADYNNVCVQQCSLPYYAYLPTKQCVSRCPNPNFNDIKDHKCKPCPTICTACTTYQYCTSCSPSYYLQNGQCVQTCSDGYYADTSIMKCVTSKLCRPKYGINSTHTCSTTCPVGSYKNNNVYRCDACQDVCLTCTGWTYCLTCNTTISVMYSNFCYRFCQIVDNDTDADGVIQPYYSVDNQSCVLTCPAGTYLVIVYCKTCAAQCETCSITGTNCTRCTDGLYLQNQLCVTTCSSGYKPTITRTCSYCGSTCGDALTFNTNITQIDGQNTIFITFTDNITINGDPNTVFGLQQQTSRRLLASGYSIVVVDSKTIKIIIQDQSDASKYTVKILQPQNIQDIYGNLPAKVRDQVQIDLANTYTTTVNTASSNFSMYFTIMAMLCVASFLFDIEFMKFMQLLFVHYFVTMILPPQLSKVLLAFRYSTLYYIPTMYVVPQAVLKETVSGKIYDAVGDFSFLRNGGFALTPLAIIIVVWIVLKILSVPQVNTRKQVRMWCKQQLDEKFQFAVVVEWLSIMYLNSIFFIFMQMRDYKNYDTFYLVSIIIAHVFVFVLAVCFVFLASRVISFFKQYPKLSYNLKKATDLLLQESQYQKLNSTNIFLFEMKKIDLRNLYYPKINNQNILPFRNIYRFSFLPLCCIHVTYLRATILSAILVFGTSTLMQMALCIPLNVLTLLYFIRARPFSFKFKKRRIRNYVAIYQEVALIVFQLMMLALGILDRDLKSSFQKEMFSNYIIYYLCVVCTISFLYFLFRVAVQVYRRIWMPFTQSELFKINFPEKYKELHGDKQKKLLKGIDPKSKQALRALIKGYKRQRSSLRPNQEQKNNSQLPMKYKVTYFDRDASSIGSASSMSKAQKRKMLKEIFEQEDDSQNMIKGSKTQLTYQQYEEVQSALTEPEYEEYEQEIQIKVKDLEKYVKNAKQILRIKKIKQEEFYKQNYGH